MNPVRKRIRLHAAGVALCGALLVAACQTDNVTDLTEDRPVLKMVIAPGDAVYPSGSVALSKAVVSGFDFSVADGFDRGTGPAGFFRVRFRQQRTVHAPLPWIMGVSVRNSSAGSPAPRDCGRVPPRVGGSLRHVGTDFDFQQPRPLPPGDWDIWGEVHGSRALHGLYDCGPGAHGASGERRPGPQPGADGHPGGRSAGRVVLPPPGELH